MTGRKGIRRQRDSSSERNSEAMRREEGGKGYGMFALLSCSACLFCLSLLGGRQNLKTAVSPHSLFLPARFFCLYCRSVVGMILPPFLPSFLRFPERNSHLSSFRILRLIGSLPQFLDSLSSSHLSHPRSHPVHGQASTQAGRRKSAHSRIRTHVGTLTDAHCVHHLSEKRPRTGLSLHVG